ncbi:hypothetical protein ACFLVS_02495 [Chloroflexota bacterium]
MTRLKNKKLLAIVITVLVIALYVIGIVASPLLAGGAPLLESAINYQGQLTDSAGNPLSGTYDMEFQIWNLATGGSQVGSTITKENVNVDAGMFNAKLEVNQTDFNGQAL